MGQNTQVETERLILRPPQLSDAVHIAALVDDVAARMTSGMPYPCPLDMAQAFVARIQGDTEDRPFMIHHRQAGVVGMTGFYRSPGPYFELGFWMAAAFRGQGLTTEAVEASMVWARDDWGLRAVASGHFVDNPASARVLDQVGFLYTGVVERQFSHGRQGDVDTRLMIWLA